MSTSGRTWTRKLSSRFLCAFTFLLSTGTTALLSIFTVYTFIENSPLRIPFTIVSVLNCLNTLLIVAFALWKFSRVTAFFVGVVPSLITILCTAGLFCVGVIKYEWLPHIIVGRDTRWLLTTVVGLWGVMVVMETVFWTLVIVFVSKHLAIDEKQDKGKRGRSQSMESMDSVAAPSSTEGKATIDGPKSPIMKRSVKDVHIPSPRLRTEPPPRINTNIPLAPSPMPAVTAVPSSPFLAKLSKVGNKASPHTPNFPIPLTDQETAAAALFDEWDTSSIPVHDQVLYSLAAAESLQKPGQPSHEPVRPSGQSIRSLTSPGGSSSYHKSDGSAATSSSNISPGRPSTSDGRIGGSSPQRAPIGVAVSTPAMMGFPLCDSTERESTLQSGTTFLRPSHSAHQLSVDSSISNISSIINTPADDIVWQTKWAEQLKRKVTPPLPGFELSPHESMRQMREQKLLEQERENALRMEATPSPTSQPVSYRPIQPPPATFLQQVPEQSQLEPSRDSIVPPMRPSTAKEFSNFRDLVKARTGSFQAGNQNFMPKKQSLRFNDIVGEFRSSTFSESNYSVSSSGDRESFQGFEDASSRTIHNTMAQGRGEIVLMPDGYVGREV